MREAPYRQGFNLLREGKGQPSILSHCLQRGVYSIDTPPDEEVIKDVTWIAYAGGAETSQPCFYIPKCKRKAKKSSIRT
ncbi:hypothetical protein PTI98_000020 [Pleurotus ostreatus]|nr:hypothetical protein PTI98_000020 [Pleurotus ostreatus]